MALCPLLTNFQSCLNSDTLLYCVHLNVLLVVDLSGYSRKLFPYLKHMHHYGGHQDLRRISTPVSQDLICNQGGELRAHVLSCRLCRRASRPPTTGTSSQCPDTTGLWSTDQLRLTPHFQDVNCFKAYITDLIFSINSCSLILFEKKKNQLGLEQEKYPGNWIFHLGCVPLRLSPAALGVCPAVIPTTCAGQQQEEKILVFKAHPR